MPPGQNYDSMFDELTLGFGKYRAARPRVEQVALEDYPYLVWVYRTAQEGGLQRYVSTRCKNRIEETIKKLNDFTPQVKCDVCKEKRARDIVIEHGDGMRIAEYPAFICRDDRCQDVGGSVLSRCKSYSPKRLEFDTLLSFPKNTPGRIMDAAHSVMRLAVGWPTGLKIDGKTTSQFIDGLTPKGPSAVQTDLF